MDGSGDEVSNRLQNELAAAREFGRRRLRLRMWATGVLLAVFTPVGCAVAFSRDAVYLAPRSGPAEIFIAVLVACALAEVIVRSSKRKMLDRVAAEFGVDPESLELAGVDLSGP